MEGEGAISPDTAKKATPFSLVSSDARKTRPTKTIPKLWLPSRTSCGGVVAS